jgi:NADPH-dependent 2,4-dienoyl-CoA reductase/sulfur reductase-like enzyme/peroxiredoxin family protein/rhodanese-related sulfurtransferase/TusA-related sulfurtransferase
LSEVTSIDRQAKTLRIINLKTGEEYRESYDVLILSPGAEPIVPDIPGVHSPRVFTLRNIPDTDRIKHFIDNNAPQSAVVVGGGYIGVEMAENLSSAGLAVTLVELADQLIAPLDRDVACSVHRHMEEKGVRLLLGNAVKELVEEEGGLTVALEHGSIRTDMLVMAVGVRPESKLAKTAGLHVNERGSIVVDAHMRTSDECIYAVGDAAEVTELLTGQKAFIPLAGPANKQGRIAADNVCGIPSTYQKTQGSAILKVFDMTVATTGLNEKTAKRLGLRYDKSFTYSPSHAGYYPGAVDMLVKTIFDKETGKILGVQIVGFDGVDKRCDVFATAIRAGMTAADLTHLELCYAPPYSSAKDPVNIAGHVIENLLSGRTKNVHWHEVNASPDVVLLDVRLAMEYENEHIDGSIHIPEDELRTRLHELDKSKKIYVLCQIGQRGYFASRTLSQNGFDAYNLSGGYRLYRSIFGKKTPPGTDMPHAPMGAQHGSSKAEVHANTFQIDACGLQCPGPIVKLSAALKEAQPGALIEISTTDPGFAADIEAYCRRTGHVFLGMKSAKGIHTARIQKPSGTPNKLQESARSGKNFIVFSGDLDKAIASFVMANAAAALGRKTSMFFTFWGLNILRKPEKVAVKKELMPKMFGMLMPRGSKKLKMSKMNMGGMGAKMIRGIMKSKNVDSLESLIETAQKNGVELLACAMSMDVMGIHAEELIDGVKFGGAATMLAHAEESDMSLFI